MTKKKASPGYISMGYDRRRWNRAGWPEPEINKWRRVFRLEEASGWRSLGVEWAEAVKWHEAGVSPQQAEQLIASGMDAATYLGERATTSPVRCRQCGFGMVEGQPHECR